MKPLFCYQGGKQTIADRILSILPPHDAYIEPFFGSGAVFFKKPRQKTKHYFEVINDHNLVIISFYRCFQERNL